MADLWHANSFRFTIGGFDSGASLWISDLAFSRLDASTRDPRSKVALQIPLDISQRVSMLEAHFKSVSGLAYETEVVDQVSKIDAICIKQKVQSTGATVPGMLLFRFEPSRTATRFIKSRSGHLIIMDDAGVDGRIAVTVRSMAIASWRFDRGWLFALDSAPIAPGSPGNVLLVPETLRRG